jgi:hypothetical protein
MPLPTAVVDLAEARLLDRGKPVRVGDDGGGLDGALHVTAVDDGNIALLEPLSEGLCLPLCDKRGRREGKGG